MSGVKQFVLSGGFPREHADGKYVLYKDYATLLSRVEELENALRECVYEISSNKQFAGKVALEPSANTKRILSNARAALKEQQT